MAENKVLPNPTPPLQKKQQQTNKDELLLLLPHQNYIFFWGIDKFLLKFSSKWVFWGFFILVFISIVKFELIYSDLKFKWPFFFFSECCGCNERWAYPRGWIAADRWHIQNFIRYRFSRELFICTYKLALIKISTYLYLFHSVFSLSLTALMQ